MGENNSFQHEVAALDSTLREQTIIPPIVYCQRDVSEQVYLDLDQSVCGKI